MHRLALVFCLAVAAGMPARSAIHGLEVAGIRLPDRVSLAGRDMVLNGAGLRRILLMKIYVAALYLPERRHDARAVLDRDIPRSLQLTLLRDLSTEQNLDALKGGLADNNGPREMAAIGPQVDRFLELIRGLGEVSAGSVIRLDYLPGEGTRVSLDGRPLGRVPGEAFNRAVLKIWLGDDPVQVSLKRALLGEG
ncbi:MAG: chalcone isomerase family protein [Thiobacillaceae bacterium]|jgi:hypothetical protein|nr:chalcone isomerase family protein [Thiobacillaceae bacterium]